MEKSGFPDFLAVEPAVDKSQRPGHNAGLPAFVVAKLCSMITETDQEQHIEGCYMESSL